MSYNKYELKTNAKNRTGLPGQSCFQRVSGRCEEAAESGQLSPASSRGETYVEVSGRVGQDSAYISSPDRNSTVRGKPVNPGRHGLTPDDGAERPVIPVTGVVTRKDISSSGREICRETFFIHILWDCLPLFRLRNFAHLCIPLFQFTVQKQKKESRES